MRPWLIIFPIWTLLAVLYWWTHRKIYRKIHPIPANPEVVVAGRKLYEDGEFKRKIVSRIPSSLFEDQLKLECGHEACTFHNDPSTETNCHKCAQQWIDSTSRKEKKP
jgi:ribosomal protein S27E